MGLNFTTYPGTFVGGPFIAAACRSGLFVTAAAAAAAAAEADAAPM